MDARGNISLESKTFGVHMQVDVQPMGVSEAEDTWSCPTGIVPINSTPTDVSFLPALPAKDVKALPDVHLVPANMILDKGWQNTLLPHGCTNPYSGCARCSCLLYCALAQRCLHSWKPLHMHPSRPL